MEKYKQSNVTVLLAASCIGEKHKPLVIGKSAKPRCFKYVNIKNLPIIWKANTVVLEIPEFK